jgi:sporulation protein YlmC with PRC-barrel domain
VRGLSRSDPETTPLQLGRRAQCSDGVVGRVSDVVVEPEKRRLTHLVVEEPEGRARLVPAHLLAQIHTRDLTVVLACTKADVLACESIRSFVYAGISGFPRDDEHTDVGVEETIVVPNLGPAELTPYSGDVEEGYGVTYDRIPHGSAELRRRSPVMSADDHEVGHVDGLLLAGEQVTHVVLQTGHHFGTRPLAIPVEAVTSIETDRIALDMSKDAVDSLRRESSRWRPFA